MITLAWACAATAAAAVLAKRLRREQRIADALAEIAGDVQFELQSYREQHP